MYFVEIITVTNYYVRHKRRQFEETQCANLFRTDMISTFGISQNFGVFTLSSEVKNNTGRGIRRLSIF